MKIELDIKKLAQEDRLKILSNTETRHMTYGKYLGELTGGIEKQLLTLGVKRVIGEGSLEFSNRLFEKNGEDITLTTRLKEDASEARLYVEGSNEIVTGIMDYLMDTYKLRGDCFVKQ